MTTQPVVLETRRAGTDTCIGIATLNAPASLNALTQPILDTMTAQLQIWRADPAVVCVVVQGAGDRALCAGGDVVSLYRLMQPAPGQPNRAVEHFLASEYRLHYTLHTFGKPVLCWGHGVAMGSGLGILQGASHRVVTETARFAMPEVGIGLFPDAGATWFLTRMPDRLGLYLGLTGTLCNAGDALFVGLGDYFVSSDAQETVLDTLPGLNWRDDPIRNHALLAEMLQETAASCQDALPASPVRAHADAIRQMMCSARLEDVVAAIQTSAVGDDWLERGAQAVATAAPLSLRVFFEQYRRGLKLSLKEAFQLEAVMGINAVRHTDLAEGIRARLVDKDLAPRWDPVSLEAVTATRVAAYFTLPSDYAHNPLADLPV